MSRKIVYPAREMWHKCADCGNEMIPEPWGLRMDWFCKECNNYAVEVVVAYD